MRDLKKLFYKHKRLFTIFFLLCAVAIINFAAQWVFYSTSLSADYYEFGKNAPGVTYFVNTIEYIFILTFLPTIAFPNDNRMSYAFIVIGQFLRTLPLTILTSFVVLFIYAFIINNLIKLFDLIFKKLNINIKKALLKKVIYTLLIGLIFIGGSLALLRSMNGGGKAYKSKEALCNEFQQSYLSTVAKTENIDYSDKKWSMAIYVGGNLYDLCMVELNEKTLRQFKMSNLDKFKR